MEFKNVVFLQLLIVLSLIWISKAGKLFLINFGSMKLVLIETEFVFAIVIIIINPLLDSTKNESAEAIRPLRCHVCDVNDCENFDSEPMVCYLVFFFSS